MFSKDRVSQVTFPRHRGTNYVMEMMGYCTMLIGGKIYSNGKLHTIKSVFTEDGCVFLCHAPD